MVDLDGLDLPEEGILGGELRIHHDIPPDRLTLYTEPVIASLEHYVDPATYRRQNHPTCIRLLDAARAEGRLQQPEIACIHI